MRSGSPYHAFSSQGPGPAAILSLRSPSRKGRRPTRCFRLLLFLLRLLDLRPRIAQRHRSVEDELLTRRIGIDTEIALALELVTTAHRGSCQAGLHPARQQH